MTHVTDLGRLERDAFRKFYDDGTFDLFLGAMLGLMPLTSAIESWTDNEAARIAMLILVYGGLAAVLVTVRRRLLRSRLGEFTPGLDRRRKIRSVYLVLGGSVVLGLLAFAAAAIAVGEGSSLTDLEYVVPLAWFLNATVVLGLMAHYLGVPRLYLHGVLFGSALLLAEWPRLLWDTDIETWIAFGVPGAVILSIGLWKLVHFLRDYPPIHSGEALQ